MAGLLDDLAPARGAGDRRRRRVRRPITPPGRPQQRRPAATAGLGNTMWVVDFNRQSLDRVVPGVRINQWRGQFESLEAEGELILHDD